VRNDKRKLQQHLAEKYARAALADGLKYGDPEAIRQVKRFSQLSDQDCRKVLRDVADAMRRGE